MEETLGKRISANRKRLGLTQDRLADLLGVTAQAVSKWENDQSCPDIQTLPRLSQIFGISTDALLGNEPRSVQTEPAGQRDRTVEVTVPRTGRKATLGLAVWLLLAGALMMLFQYKHYAIGTWTVLWTTGLTVFGLFGLWPHFSVFRLGCAITGGYFLGQWLFSLPALGISTLLLILGGLLLVDALFNHRNRHIKIGVPSVKGIGSGGGCTMEGEAFHCESTFSERNFQVTLPRLREGSARLSFGEQTVDLSGCGEIADGARVHLECSFGELNLLVPGSCRVVNNISSAFADCKVRGTPDAAADRTLSVDGSVSFGEIRIRYI